VTKYLGCALLALTALSAAPDKQTITGTITDDMCAAEGHARMRMGPTDAECTAACVSIHDAAYVLQAGKIVYVLSDQRTPAPLAGRKVRVVGAVDPKTRTITVDSITAAD
jgi:hypothetical protein